MHGLELPPLKQTVEPQPKPQQPQQPLQTEQSQQQQATEVKKSQPIAAKKIDTKMMAIIGVAAVLLIGLLIAIFSGGSDEVAEEPVVVEVVPVINYDSLATVSIAEADRLKQEADDYAAAHKDDLYDEQFGKIEEKYGSALSKYKEALQDKDSLSADVAGKATIGVSEMKNKLLSIYNDFVETAKQLGASEAATKFNERAEAIKPLVEDLINTETTNENTDNNEE